MSKLLVNALGSIHDAAWDAWDTLHEGHADDHYLCKLCGEAMYPCIDYTHAPSCPLEVLGLAIDAFADTCFDAAAGSSGPPSTEDASAQ